MHGATEPVTLTDPDGSVTRIAPWASWTREQVRPPGGDAVLVTRLDRGQLWFSAGTGGDAATWRHEVHVGSAVVTTTTGRCHVVAEPDGGATVTCLDGEVQVATRLRAPVLLTVDRAAAVSADGETLVVIEQAPGAAALEADAAALAADPDAGPGTGADAEPGEAAVEVAPALIPVSQVRSHGGDDDRRGTFVA
ncbi:MAG: hypothetical protein JWM05_2883, partial [Acidimicrobiales bacterium]|nr:hypothetical protein [Acidimicrobiales bacterium]